ncbi:MAG: UDP-glucose 4-epimerase GalE [Pyrinomonadaceae bacterium]|nr:UDP-glucose 4-epimerase GalE [Phycisphaerales bacterium]
MNVLVTGGAGYIGSHAVQRLLRDGHTVVAVDTLFRGHREAIERLIPTAGGRLHFVQADVGNTALMIELLKKHSITSVLHFAAIAYVGESVTQPLTYYRNNTVASLSLIEAIDAVGGQVDRLVFSSTCASYGEPSEEFIPIPETCPQAPINPYGASKLFVERMLFDYAASLQVGGSAAEAARGTRPRPFAFAALRYFNVAGSDSTGVLGEHHEPETHLIPVVLQAAMGQRESVTIFGTDYPTPDGTCIRDYVHVEDLIDAHVTVLGALKPGDTRTYNLGIGKGSSVREIIQSVQRVTGKEFPIKEGKRRPGDPPRLFADPRKIKAELGWQAQRTNLDETVKTAWNWFKANPRGYSR